MRVDPIQLSTVTLKPDELTCMRWAAEGRSMQDIADIENMSYHICSSCGHREHIFGHGGARKAAADAQVPFLGEIPLETAIRDKADAGTPIVAADPHHPVSEAFKNIAARIWAALPEQKPAQQLKG